MGRNSKKGGIVDVSILGQLPATFTKDDVVFIAAGPRVHRIGRLKTIIDALDHRGKWIRATFSDAIPQDSIPKKMTLALMMGGIPHPSWQNVVLAAEQTGACAPNRLFSTAEVANILAILAARRMEGSGDEEPSAESESAENSFLPEATLARREIDSALAVLEEFLPKLEPGIISFMLAADRIETLSAENEAFRQEVGAMKQKMAKLEERVCVMRGFKKERNLLRASSRAKDAEIGRMEVTLSQVEASLKAFRRQE
jgi:hypothetical protein